jgi:putative acetyltransferase
VEKIIREYADSDCDGVIEAWHAASLVATPFLSAEFMSAERVNIRTKWIPMAESWVSEVDSKIAGFISLIGNEVGAIFVHPDYQGQGIGRALMDHAASLRDDLVLDVFEENSIGRRFYDRYGFQFESKHLHDDTGRMQIRLSYKPKEGGAASGKN